jgi:hypothetical protein
MYNVTLRRVHATITTTVKQYTLHILSVCCSPVARHAARMR